MTSQNQTAQKTAGVLNQLEPVARSYVQRLLQQNGTPISQMPVDKARA